MTPSYVASGMAQQLLDEARVRACFQQVGGEAVPQGVGRDGIT
jgi:hypothetical protein